MNRRTSFLIDFILAALVIGMTAAVTRIAAAGYGNAAVLEYAAYIALALFCLRVYHRALPFPAGRVPMIAGALISGVGFTAALWLMNGIWKWVTFRAMFSWGHEITLIDHLAESLTYSVGLAEFRYPATCAAMALLCAFSRVIIERMRRE